MNELLYIDNQDAYTTWGVFVAVGGYNSLVQYPKPKSYTVNNWHEENGEEIDNRAFVYESRNITVNFAIVGNEARYKSFIDSINNGVFHSFNFAQIGYSLNLRYVSCSSYQYGNNLGLFSVVLCDDSSFLADGYTFNPIETKYGENANFLNLLEFNKFGVTLLDGYDTIGKTPNAKGNMTNNYSYQDGVEYGNTGVTYERKQSTLRLMLQADSVALFWKQYKDFFWSLNCLDADESHKCKWQYLNIGKYQDKFFSVYYLGQTIQDLYLKGNGGMIAVFDLSLVVDEKTDDMTFLISESGELIVTEDNYLIRI